MVEIEKKKIKDGYHKLKLFKLFEVMIAEMVKD
jgi:hypothetical protein